MDGFALTARLRENETYRYRPILGANAHVTVYAQSREDEFGRVVRTFPDYTQRAERVAEVPGVTRVAPLVKGQVMGTANGRNAGVEVFGIAADDLAAIPRIADPETGQGDIARFDEGIAIGSGVARELGVGVGDEVRLISPDGVKTAFGVSPRVVNRSDLW